MASNEGGTPAVPTTLSDKADDVLCYVDGLELVRESIKLSSSIAEYSNILHGEAESSYLWLLGVEASQESVPLLRVISAGYLEEYSSSKLFFFFEPFNLKVESTQLCNYKNRHGNYISIGDLILFAFQLQTGVTSSWSITQLGHLPISPLERKTLALLLRQSTTSNALQPPTSSIYNPREMLTEVSLLDSTKPVLCPSLEVFRLLFACDTINEVSVPISFINRPCSEHKRSLTASTSNNIDLDSTCAEGPPPSETSLRSNLLNRRFLTDENASEYFTQVIDLFNIFTLVRSGGNSFGNETYQLYQQYGSRSAKNAQNTQTVKQSSMHLPQQTPQEEVTRLESRHTPIFSSRLDVAVDVLAYLKRYKRKPIIVVPSYMGQNAIPPVLHTINCKQFLEEKIMNLEAKCVGDVLQAPVPFYWKSSLPWRTSSGQRQSLTLDFKIVGSSQSIKFSVNDWYRVLAVVVQGAEWQFYHWPFESLNSLFSFVKPIYFAYESDTLPPLVTEFNIDVLRVRRSSRHGDIAVWDHQNEYLKTLDNSFPKKWGLGMIRPKDLVLWLNPNKDLNAKICFNIKCGNAQCSNWHNKDVIRLLLSLNHIKATVYYTLLKGNV